MRSDRAPDGGFEAAGLRGRTGRLEQTGLRGRARLLARLGCAFVAAIALVALGLAVRQDLQVSSGLLTPAAINRATAADSQAMCLFQAFRRALPKGATFYDGGAGLARFQRLAELATLWAVPERTRAAARWRVAIVPGHCARIGLKAWRA